MKLRIFGSYKGPTGYDIMVRNIAKCLHGKGDELNLIDHAQWSGIKIAYDPLFDKLAENKDLDAEVILGFCLPNQLPIVKQPYNVCFSMLECDRIPSEWAMISTVIDLNIVPSQSSYDAWVNSGVPEYRMAVCPLGVDTDVYNPAVGSAPLKDEEGQLLVDRYPIRVMNIQEIGPRKNIKGLLRAWMQATRNDGEMCLILKIGSYSGNRMIKYRQMVYELHKELGVTNDDYAPIFHHCSLMRDDQMPHFMAAATHYIATSFGEGWDLPAMQAAAMKRPIIVPQHSAYLQWTDDETAHTLGVAAIPAQADGGLRQVYANAVWWKPNHDEVVAAVESLKDSGFRAVLEVKSDKMLARLQGEYTWNHAADRLSAILHERWFDVPLASVEKAENSRTIVWIPTLGSPCGIAAYASKICESMSDQKKEFGGWVGGNVLNHDRMLDMNVGTGVEHLQMEYQFWSPVRLKAIGRELKRREMPLVITMHTVADTPAASEHNEVVRQIANKVIVHSSASRDKLLGLGFERDQVTILPMPVYGIEPDEDVQQLPDDRFKIGFFGFLYRHKGILQLVEAIGGMDDKPFLMMCASKPTNPHDEIDVELKSALIEHEMEMNTDYLWQSDYLSDEKVIGYLRQCDLIALPYIDYGPAGTSAAVGTVAAAGKAMLLSDVCWFSHVPRGAAYWCDPPEGQDGIDKLRATLESVMETSVSEHDSKVKAMRMWARACSVEGVASQHIELYDSLAGSLVEA